MRRRVALPSGAQFDAVESFHDHPLLLDAFRGTRVVRAAEAGRLVISPPTACPLARSRPATLRGRSRRNGARHRRPRRAKK